MENESEPKPKPVDSSVLEKVIDFCLLNFRTYIADIRSVQIELLKTYLWISSFLVTVQLGVFEYFKPEKHSGLYFIPFCLGVSSLILSLWVFALALLNLRVPNKEIFFIDDPEVYFNQANSPDQCLRAFIYDIDKTSRKNFATDIETGKKIRKLASPLIVSIIILIFSAIFYYFLGSYNFH
ncbi:MAG: hypothetical protein AB1847_17450 [bacterium]